MDNFKILTFAKGNFIESQIKLNKVIKSYGNYEIINKNENDIEVDFFIENEKIFNHIKGYGFCIWKPYFILNELKKLNTNEVLVYIDSTDYPTESFFIYLNNHFKLNDYLFVNRGYNHGQWTKRDCFVYMDCDESKYYNHVQLEAGVMAFKNNDFNIKLIEEWLKYCKDDRILVDSPNISGKNNINNYIEHRYDQSILTNIIIKNNLESYFLNSNIIKYNYNQPIKYS
jgi:hypothetical protein